MGELQLVEFYMACNPPLLPSGVHHFMQELKNAPIQKTGKKVLEILYEPSGPWFKVITYRLFKAEVTDAIAALLATITEDNTRFLEQPEEYSGCLADIGTTSLAIPWAAFSASSKYQTDFVQWQFPVEMQGLAFKTVWPQKSLAFNLTEMLQMQARLDGSQTKDPKVGSLDSLLGCTVSSNLQETVLYIGTNSRETLKIAHEILDALLDITEQAAAITTQHVIYTPEPSEKFSYRWFSHIGLDSRTFVQPPPDTERLRRAVSIRAVGQGPQRRSNTYSTHGKPDALTISKFWLTTLFLQHKYPPKKAQRSSSDSEIMVSMNSNPPDTKFSKHTTASCPSPRENGRIEPHSVVLTAMDEMLIFDMDDVSRSSSQSAPSTQQHNQPSLASLLDDDPPANLPSSIWEPKSSEPEPETAEIKNHRSRPHVIKLLEKNLQSFWPMLARCPGFVTVHVQFGRFYLTDLSSADVDIGTGPHRKMTDLLRELEGVERERIGFSTILSRLRSDADLFVKYPTSPWVLLGEDLIYQIQCTLDDKQLTIDVDATTFDFSCHGPTSELGCTLVHCVQRAWDLKLAVNHSSNLNKSPDQKNIGQAITNSLQVSTAQNGEHVFELMTDKQGWSITAVRIRHMTRYKSTRTPGSILSVAEFQTLRAGEEKDRRRRWTIPSDASSKGHSPESWLEAYISSSTLDALLRGNANLLLGGYLPWDVSQQEAIFDGLFQPALETVAQLDDVGICNDNGFGGKLSFVDAEEREIFW
ncbi:hypothetical protein E4U54_008278 [Claviceps lovelessii]|nr:hypothetical protein E4U54_008278 [Claviceps lovelessii]